MDFLKAEMERKKRQMEENDVMAPDKKYFKRGDLAAKQTEEYLKRNKRISLENIETAEEFDGKAGHSCGEGTSEQAKHNKIMPRKEVIRRLRERDEPVRLFGESDAESYQRLKRVEMLQPEVIKGFKNDFKTAMERVDKEYLNDIIKGSGMDSEQLKKADVKTKDDGSTYEDIIALSVKLGQGDTSIDASIVLKFLKHILNLWGQELNHRPAEEKRSFQGKMASAMHAQTVDYIKPLFKKLKRETVDHIILECLADICKHLFDRHYINANDAYLQMAIGNAPWPIGVTMVGIHARTGREKIFARNVAHVLNDETQRKYIQAVKRLMKQCQKLYPTDPSRSVDYESTR